MKKAASVLLAVFGAILLGWADQGLAKEEAVFNLKLAHHFNDSHLIARAMKEAYTTL